jgi:GTPase-associated adaptor domain-containing protein
MDPGRRLVYRFFGLPYHQRMTLVRALALLEPDEQNLPEMERFRRVFRRAREKGILPSLWTEVEALHPDGDVTENPFLGAP